MLKNKVWGVNVTGEIGVNGQNDIEIGENEFDEPSIRIGNSVVTSTNVFGCPERDSLTKINDFLYEIEYTDLDRKFAEKYADIHYMPFPAACSSVRKGNWYGRNFDWTYNNQVSFLVHTNATEDHYASVGVASSIPGLNKGNLYNRENIDAYRILPFMMLDGINEHGVVCNTNVVPCQYGKTTGTKPLLDQRDSVCVMWIVRYILDHYKTASEAVEDIVNHVSVYCYKTLWDMEYELHVMVADELNTYIIEFINNNTVVIDVTGGENSLSGRSYMTNFFLYNMVPNSDGTVYTPATMDDQHDAIKTNHITSHGSGLERYNLIANNFNNCGTRDNMHALMMDKLRYTKAYQTSTSPFWYTEFVGVRGLSVDSPASEYEPIIPIVEEMFNNRNRDDGKTWHTAHSCIYDIANRKVYVSSQEEDIEYVFTIPYVGKNLPRVSTQDNGKTLKVVDGQWTLV